MTDESVTINGVVHGKTVELECESGLPDGQQVSVTMKPAGERGAPSPGEGLKKAFGAWADDAAELDKYLEWNRQQRQRGRRELEP